jgi:hypothetical protein
MLFPRPAHLRGAASASRSNVDAPFKPGSARRSTRPDNGHPGEIVVLKIQRVLPRLRDQSTNRLHHMDSAEISLVLNQDMMQHAISGLESRHDASSCAPFPPRAPERTRSDQTKPPVNKVKVGVGVDPQPWTAAATPFDYSRAHIEGDSSPFYALSDQTASSCPRSAPPLSSCTGNYDRMESRIIGSPLLWPQT